MTATAQPGALFVGVDGGGTGCRARIEDAEGPCSAPALPARPRCASELTARLPKWKRPAASRSRKPGLALTSWAPCMPLSGSPGSAAKACSSSSSSGRIPSAPSFTPMTRRSPASGRMAPGTAASSLSGRAASALPLSGDARSGLVATVFPYPMRAAGPISGCTRSAWRCVPTTSAPSRPVSRAT